MASFDQYRIAVERGTADDVLDMLARDPDLLYKDLTPQGYHTFDVLADRGDWRFTLQLFKNGYTFHPNHTLSPLEIAFGCDQDEYLYQVVGQAPERDLIMLIQNIMSFHRSRLSKQAPRWRFPAALGFTAVDRLQNQNRPKVLEAWAIQSALANEFDLWKFHVDHYGSALKGRCGVCWLFHGARELNRTLIDVGLVCGAEINDEFRTTDFPNSTEYRIRMTALGAVFAYPCRSQSERDVLNFIEWLIQDKGADTDITIDWEDDRYFLKGASILTTAESNGFSSDFLRSLKGISS